MEVKVPGTQPRYAQDCAVPRARGVARRAERGAADAGAMQLGIFPEDEQIPYSVLQKLWGEGRAERAGDERRLDELKKWELVEVDARRRRCRCSTCTATTCVPAARARRAGVAARAAARVRHEEVAGRSVSYECGKAHGVADARIEEDEKTDDDACRTGCCRRLKHVAHHIAGGGPTSLDKLKALQTLKLNLLESLTSLPSLDGLKTAPLRAGFARRWGWLLGQPDVEITRRPLRPDIAALVRTLGLRVDEGLASLHSSRSTG